ncbi:hypothetical protein B0T14DRAFT_15709 [Immersiella caudata]|uniref:Extracellular membrane protein CFEM domain-containing protein n=1 Tax=Immersiella caudata TaxID=314043 RepID=A0AA39XDG3_9PEZI|nr:hypothetical protein B0T14DRAFT_15709 [Immersiella caudata]
MKPIAKATAFPLLITQALADNPVPSSSFHEKCNQCLDTALAACPADYTTQASTDCVRGPVGLQGIVLCLEPDCIVDIQRVYRNWFAYCLPRDRRFCAEPETVKVTISSKSASASATQPAVTTLGAIAGTSTSATSTSTAAAVSAHPAAILAVMGLGFFGINLQHVDSPLIGLSRQQLG